MKPALVIHAPDGTQTTLPLSARPLKFGRAETCDCILRNDAEVSREHAEIWLDERQGVLVYDRGSKNGTRVDDGEAFRSAKRVARRCVHIGEHEIRIVGLSPATEAVGPVTFLADDETTQIGDSHFFPSTRGIELNEKRLARLMQLSERIGGVFDRKQLLEEALDACCEALGFERGLIALKTPRGDAEHPVTRNVQQDEHGAFKVSRTLINRAMVHGERAVVNNPATDLPPSDSLVRFPICSALCVPVLYRDEILGVIYGDRVTQASTYEPADVDFLAAIARQVGTGLANLRMLLDHLDAQRVRGELQRAREIQQQLLPAAPLRVGRVSIEGTNEASSAVSGDYFDYFPLEGGRLGLIIADVTGHGLPASLMMANLQAAIRVALSPDVHLAQVAERINRLICQNTGPHVFITAILGRADVETGVVEYVSAGHPPPLMIAESEVVSPPEQNSLPLGVEPEETYTVVRVDPTDRVRAMLFYTDGAIEAIGPRGHALGVEGLTHALREVLDPAPGKLIDAARNLVRTHLDGKPLPDDMTLMALQFLGRA